MQQKESTRVAVWEERVGYRPVEGGGRRLQRTRSVGGNLTNKFGIVAGSEEIKYMIVSLDTGLLVCHTRLLEQI